MTSPAIPSPKGEMRDKGVNYEAWSRSLIGFIRSRNLEHELTDWCGGWECPIEADANALSSSSREEVRREALEEAAKVVDAMIAETRSLADFPIDPISDRLTGSAGTRLKYAILGRVDGLVRLAASIRALSQGE